MAVKSSNVPQAVTRLTIFSVHSFSLSVCTRVLSCDTMLVDLDAIGNTGCVIRLHSTICTQFVGHVRALRSRDAERPGSNSIKFKLELRSQS